MSDTSQVSMQGGTAGNARLIYFLFLFAPILFQLLAIAGVVMAYLGKGQGDALIDNHYRNQINIFWKMLLYCVIGGVLSVILIGMLILLAAIVWYIVRVVKGIQALGEGRMVEHPESWLF